MKLIILSGGQTGADRAGLDFAIESGLDYEGFCPLGRKAEDGRIPEKYKLTETNTYGYSKRTYCNVFYSDATLIFINSDLTPGSKYTENICKRENKLYKIINFSKNEKYDIKKWIEENNIKKLNIAGSRESIAPGIYKLTKDFLINNIGN